MKKICAVFVLLALTAGGIFSMEWPVSGGTILKNFGYNEKGQPVLGINFRSEDTVKAAEQGELLFSSEEDNSASGLPPVLGTWLALDHGGGIIGIYSRMEQGSRAITDFAEKSEALGQSGSSGWSSEKGVYFSLFDRKEKRWINPAIIISSLPDPGPLTIQSVKLRDPGGKIISLMQGMTIGQGRYTILVEAAQVFQGQTRNPLSPFRIIYSVNGAETGRLSFETYSARDGVLMVNRNGMVPVKQIFSPWPAFELGTAVFNRGQVTMEITAQDTEGNSRNTVYRFTAE